MTGLSESDAAELRRRRRFLLLNLLYVCSGTLAGLLFAVYDGFWASYLIVPAGAVGTVYYVIRLLAPPEILLALPASYFVWLAPECTSERPRPSEGHPAEKPTLLMPESTRPWGVWDRELDSAL